MTTRVIQRTPNIGMALKLRRPSAGAPCPCALTGAGWGTMFPRSHGHDSFIGAQRQEHSQEPILDQWGHIIGFPDPTTVYAIGLTLLLPGGDSPHSYLGVPFGDICGVEWSWSFSRIAGPYTDITPGGWGGVDVSQEGAHLHVVVQPGGFSAFNADFNPVARLDATANCPDGSSASLWLVLGFYVFGAA